MLLLTFTFLASFALQRWKVRVVHESLIAILLGAVVGLIIHSSSNESVKKIVVFDHRYFFNLLLPPIILHSGYDLQVVRAHYIWYKHIIHVGTLFPSFGIYSRICVCWNAYFFISYRFTGVSGRDGWNAFFKAHIYGMLNVWLHSIFNRSSHHPGDIQSTTCRH